MTVYEKLIAEYEDKIEIEERKMKNVALYGDGIIWLNKDLTNSAKAAILAEEIGHYETTVGDILDQHSIENMKQEYRARKWALDKILPFERVLDAVRHGYYEPYEIADYLDVDEILVREALMR